MENNSTDQTREALATDIANLKRDVAQIATDVKQHAGAQVEATKSHINQKVQSFKDYATERPLAVFGVGFLVGFIVALRLRK